jgi:hypothetical protein
MLQSNRVFLELGMPDLDDRAFIREGRNIKTYIASGGGGGSSGPQQVTQTTTNLPEYARPFFEDILKRGQAESNRPYQAYGAERIAGLTPEQQAVQQQTYGLGRPGQFDVATGLTTQAGLGSIAAGQYRPGQFSAQQINMPGLQQFQMQGPQDVSAQQVMTPEMRAAQMAGPQMFGQAQVDQYMSPYMQTVVDEQKRRAIEDAKRTQLTQNLGAAREGTLGGARQLLATTERERGLREQLGDIQGRGLESAFGQAQQQFERDRIAGMQVGMANLTNQQQAAVQNQAAQLQAAGMNQEQAMRAALANQQAQMGTAQQNLSARLGVQQLGTQTGLQAAQSNQQAMLDAQRMAEQSRQFGGSLGLQGLQQAGQAAATLGQLGATQQQSDIARLQAQSAAAGQTQAMQQQRLDQQYADFLRQRDFPMEQLGYFSNLLRGMPMQMGSTQTTYAPPPSMVSQVGGLGLGALGLSNLMR